PLIISQLSHLEVSSAIVRRAGDSKSSDQEVRKALEELDREVARSLEIVGINDSLIVSAIRLTRARRLRGADAVQLASALVARGRRAAQEFIFVGSDLELNAAAAAEGFKVEN